MENGQEIPNEINERIEHALLHYKERAELLRPGFSRLSLPFKGLHQEEVEYVTRALEWIAKYGWIFMCQYRCNHRTGEWRHFSRQGKPLGRSERKWLSHYDLNYDGTTKTSHEEDHLQNSLEKAFENAEYQLKMARADQSIAQAVKMTDENDVLDSNNDLDLLRWYVYPRECASALKKGETSLPHTFDLEKISGGLRPFGHFKAAEIVFTTPLPAAESAMEEENIMDLSQATTKIESDRLEVDGLVQFRDGEHHSGEADLRDIIAGHDEGELSDACLLYVEKEDDWIPIELFIKRMNITTDSESSRIEVVEEENPSVRNSVEPVVREVDPKREKKKPSRDSSTWGKTESPQLPESKAPLVFVPDQQDDGDAEEKKVGDNSNSVKKKGKKTKHIKPPPKLMRYIMQAIIQWDMIQEGDRLLLGLSGGKDSLTLLHCLLEFQRKLPTKFEIEVCTIDPMTPSFDPSPLIPYVESLGLKYHYIRDNIVERANTSGTNGQVVKSLCAFCARMKRGNLYSTARKNNCNKLVLAQHLDDCAESFFMSAMHNGFIRSKFAVFNIAVKNEIANLCPIQPKSYESKLSDQCRRFKCHSPFGVL